MASPLQFEMKSVLRCVCECVCRWDVSAGIITHGLNILQIMLRFLNTCKRAEEWQQAKGIVRVGFDLLSHSGLVIIKPQANVYWAQQQFRQRSALSRHQSARSYSQLATDSRKSEQCKDQTLHSLINIEFKWQNILKTFCLKNPSINVKTTFLCTPKSQKLKKESIKRGIAWFVRTLFNVFMLTNAVNAKIILIKQSLITCWHQSVSMAFGSSHFYRTRSLKCSCEPGATSCHAWCLVDALLLHIETVLRSSYTLVVYLGLVSMHTHQNIWYLTRQLWSIALYYISANAVAYT